MKTKTKKYCKTKTKLKRKNNWQNENENEKINQNENHTGYWLGIRPFMPPGQEMDQAYPRAPGPTQDLTNSGNYTILWLA